MAITNNGELVAAVANWINRSDLSTEIPDFIRLAESRIAGDFKTQHLVATTTITVDAINEALPTNFRGAISAYLDTSPKTALDYLTPDEFNRKWVSSQTAKPFSYSIWGQEIHFGPGPSQTYSCILTYYSTPDIATDTTNSLLTNYPDLYLFAACKEASDFLHNESASAKWESKYQRALLIANSESDYNGALWQPLPNIV